MHKKKKPYTQVTSLTTSHEIRVRFNETDPLGIVWHGYYIHYFEDGREAFGRKYGVSYLDVQKNGFVTPIVKSSTEHKLPLKYGDVATIETTFVTTPAAKMIFIYTIKNEAGDVVCTGETTQVFVDSTGELSLVTPTFFKKWKQQHKVD
ncbi:acyl-CoA thioesterase [Cochleicola gelatinilyticus]|uniref:4-hydroxybenzoyl-CoA thioesterase n=1 Tax=Cochleicola gelatinilyticus TaxID=1763537 RepID=A0A167JC28_9FLAO|nr:acyl-CoA thioesterase [Cochleicola gelatinilyticus]OAB80529.1 4-hydroxybenzoyl-CoA thioesterase [Cochleicola gelatinilyticus]